MEIEQPTGTAAGHCRTCGSWSPENRIVKEVHSDSAAGSTVVECDGPHKREVPPSDRVRTYPL